MTATEKTMQEYSNLSGWNLSSSSTGAMTTALDQAIKNKEDIIVTGWSPHWMFSKYDLKYLKDPKGTMGRQGSYPHYDSKKSRQGLTRSQQGPG